MKTWFLGFLWIFVFALTADAGTWVRQIGYAQNFRFGRSVQVTSDGGYVAGGYLYAGSPGAWVIKLSPQGKTEWQKQYGLGTGEEAVVALRQTSDGGYVFLAADHRDETSKQASLWVVKLDPTGAVEWEKQYASGEPIRPTTIITTTDGRFFVLGWKGFYYANADIALKLDAQGGIEWQREITGVSWTHTNAVVETASGGFALVGGTNGPHRGTFFRLSAGGALVSTKLFDAGPITYFRDIAAVGNGFIVAGQNANAAIVTRLRPDGSVLWSHQYSDDGESYFGTWALHVEPTAGGYTTSAEVQDGSEGWQTEPLTLRIDADGAPIWWNEGGGIYWATVRPTTDGRYVMMNDLGNVAKLTRRGLLKNPCPEMGFYPPENPHHSEIELTFPAGTMKVGPSDIVESTPRATVIHADAENINACP